MDSFASSIHFLAIHNLAILALIIKSAFYTNNVKVLCAEFICLREFMLVNTSTSFIYIKLNDS